MSVVTGVILLLGFGEGADGAEVSQLEDGPTWVYRPKLYAGVQPTIAEECADA